MKKYISEIDDIMNIWSPMNTLNPDTLTIGSHRSALWTCQYGHNWEAEVRSICHGYGCPYCSGRLAISGVNDIMTTNPDMKERWDYRKNNIDPTTVKQGSGKMAWWKCRDNRLHPSYQRVIYEECESTVCPVCSGRLVIAGYNSVSTLDMGFLTYWDVDNNKKSMDDVSYASTYLASWKCPYGHTWKQRVSLCYQKYKRLRGHELLCSFCESNRMTMMKIHENIYETTKDFYSEKNIFPLSHYPMNSGKKLIWNCPNGHVWQRTMMEQSHSNSCPICEARKNSLGVMFPNVLSEWDYDDNNVEPFSISHASSNTVSWKCANGHSWKTPAYQRGKISPSACPYCSHSNCSNAEDEIEHYITDELKLKVTRNDKSVLGGKEIDIFIPSKKLAIEYNGIYWHTESFGRDKYYHYNKWKNAKEQGIQLIQIWEDDWLCGKKDMILHMLSHKMNCDSSRRIFARKTSVVEVDSQSARKFLDLNHIQGFVPSTHYLGLSYNGDIVALLTITMRGEQHDVANITRYATSVTVVGGFTKLLKHASAMYKPSKYITFSDHCISNGCLYEKSGFYHDKELPPDYMYVVDKKRYHKFNYRIARFKKDNSLIFRNNCTESQLAKINDIPRIWDCGKTRWVLDI